VTAGRDAARGEFPKAGDVVAIDSERIGARTNVMA
jgi:hypothetical protein